MRLNELSHLITSHFVACKSTVSLKQFQGRWFQRTYIIFTAQRRLAQFPQGLSIPISMCRLSVQLRWVLKSVYVEKRAFCLSSQNSKFCFPIAGRRFCFVFFHLVVLSIPVLSFLHGLDNLQTKLHTLQVILTIHLTVVADYRITKQYQIIWIEGNNLKANVN